MSLRKNKREIERLIDAFESEAAKFHDITFTTYTIRQESPLYNPKFRTAHHGIMLWQYYGKLKSNHDTKEFVQNYMESVRENGLQWGIRGAQVSSFGMIRS